MSTLINTDKIGTYLQNKTHLYIAFTLQNNYRNFFDTAVYIGHIYIYKILDPLFLTQGMATSYNKFDVRHS